MSKLSLDRDKIDQARKLAELIVTPILRNVERHTTPSIERSVLRLLGVEGALEENPKDPAPQGRYPLVNLVVEKFGTEALRRGAAYWFGLAAYHFPRLNPVNVARKIASGEIDVQKLAPASMPEIDKVCRALLSKSIQTLRLTGEKRKKRPPFRSFSQPLRYVIVATGNIHEDITQAIAAAEMGADIIAVIRSTAQSLLDYVPEGETTEGYGGTFATQQNFRLMRQALDQTEKKLKRRISLTNYSSGLCMPEIAVLGALEGVDYLLNDAMYGILFRDINMKRNFVDQYFSRRICALSEITIMTGEDNYLTTAESHKYWFQVLASQFINQAFAKRAGLPDSAVALGHAFEMDPWLEDSILFEWAQAQLVREIFPRSPIKFMPPTKNKSGDIFFSYLYDGMFNLAGIITGQSIQLLGMHTEAIHNPYVQDRYLSLKSAEYIFNGAKSVADEVTFQSNGKIVRRARQVFDDALRHLKKVNAIGLMQSISEGAFANVRRQLDGGKGSGSIIEKDRDYYTPLQDYLTPRQKSAEEKFPKRVRPARRGRYGEERRDSRGPERGRPPADYGRERRRPREEMPRRASEMPRRPAQASPESRRPPARPRMEPPVPVSVELKTEEVSIIHLPPPGTDLTTMAPPAPEMPPVSAEEAHQYPTEAGESVSRGEPPPLEGGRPRPGSRRRRGRRRGRRGGSRGGPGPDLRSGPQAPGPAEGGSYRQEGNVNQPLKRRELRDESHEDSAPESPPSGGDSPPPPRSHSEGEQ